MSLELQFRLKNNPNYKKYLREHSEWYKMLNRDPSSFAQFEEQVKETYQLRPGDRIQRVLESIEMVQTIISTIRP